MAITSAERVQIRRYLGASNLHTQYDPRVEDAITAIQSTADGGSQPDSETESAVRVCLAALATLQTQLQANWNKFMAGSAEEVTVDYARATMMLRAEGRRLVGELADYLAISPRRDVFSAKRIGNEGVGESLSPFGSS